MATWSCLSTTSFALALLTSSCLFFDDGAERPVDAGIEGQIAYPFVEETRPLGTAGAATSSDEKFIIRSAVGDREYSVEIPGGARDYDVMVPLGELGDAASGTGASVGKPPRTLASAVRTDQEITKDLPRLEQRRPTDSAMLDQAFGVAESEGPEQAPSYTLGLARINEYYKKRDFEYCLIEVNQLLAFYPTSPKLLKMKGTVLLKLRQEALAERAWTRALDLAPSDRGLAKALERLRKRIGMTAPAGPPTEAMLKP